MTTIILEEDTGHQGSRPQIVRPSRRIIDEVTNFFGLSAEAICGHGRAQHINKPRQLAMYFMCRNASMSFDEVGRILGDRDRTTIMHGIRVTEERIASDVEFAKQAALIESYLKGR